MYNEDKAKDLGTSGLDKPLKAPTTAFNWKLYPVEDLIRFRDEITRHLPPLTLRDIDMEQELLLQYHGLRAIQNAVLMDEGVAVNQRAQVANATSAVLAKIAEYQQTLFDSERLKRIEGVLISSLIHLPVPVAEAFLTKYEEALEKV